MMPLLLAQTDATHSALLPYLIVGMVVLGLSSIIQLALAAKQLFGGNKGERQIEPTQMQGVISELKSQTITLNIINRETGELKTQIKAVDQKIDAQGQQVENAFRRINAISIESAGVKTRVDGLENREGRRNA